MKYLIKFDKRAYKFLQKQPKNQQERLLKAIYELPDNGDIKAMAGHVNLFRLRVGDYLVIYTVHNEVLIIRVLEIGNRGQVYKKY